jgi:hypothetical protein
MAKKIEQDLSTYWENHAKSVLLGRKIVEVRYLLDEEMEMLGWYKRPIAFVLDDKTLCFLSCDDEGNDGGVIMYQKEGDDEGVIPVIY